MSAYQARQLAANLPEPEDDPDASFCQESLEVAHIAAVVYRAKLSLEFQFLILHGFQINGAWLCYYVKNT